MAMTKLEKIMKDQDVKKATKIKIAETVIFPAVTYGTAFYYQIKLYIFHN